MTACNTACTARERYGASQLNTCPPPLPAPQEYKQRKRLGGSREKETLARLAKFKQVRCARCAPAGQAANMSVADGRWITH